MLAATSPDKEKKDVIIKEEKVEPSETSKKNSLFFSDLKKSLILVSIVIALEIALYFAKLIR